MVIILLIFFVFIAFSYVTKTPRSSDYTKTNCNDSFDSSFDSTTNFINLQHTENHNSFDSYTDNCSSDNCCNDNCSDGNCDCNDSGGGCCD